MADLDNDISRLSAAKRALFELKRKQALSERGAASIPRRTETGDAPLSFAQQRLWLIHQLDPASHLYNVPRAIDLRGALDVDALRLGLNEIVRRHHVLRTTFPVVDGEPMQRVAPSFDPALKVLDVTATPLSSESLEQLLLDEYRRPFDLANGPLFRACLWKLSEHAHVLLIVMHHIVSDGWTGGLVFEELGTLYRAYASGDSPSLSELPVQYTDFAAWQRTSMQGAALEKALGYWRELLAAAPETLSLPCDFPRPLRSQYQGRIETLRLTKDLSDAIRRLCLHEGVTLFSGMFAALNILLAQWSGNEDLIVGTINANRNRTEIEKLIGCFVNFLPLRTSVTGRDTARDILERANRVALGALAHQDLPFEKLVEDLNPKRSLNVNPIYNVALLVQNFPEMAFCANDLEARFLPLDTQVAFLDLRFLVSDSEAGIRIDCEYDTALFEPSTICLLLEGYSSVMERLSAEPGTLCQHFSLPDRLKRQAETAHGRDETIAIASTFTSEPIEEPLSFWLVQLKIAAITRFAPYNQIFQTLLDSASEMGRNRRGVNLLLLRLEDWVRFDEADAVENAQRTTRDFAEALRASTSRTTVPHVVCLCPPSHALTSQNDVQLRISVAEREFASRIGGISNVSFVTYRQIAALYPVAEYEDVYASQIGQIPYTPEFFAALATMCARTIHAKRRTPYKVIAIDCDNTLWKGVCGEDGPLGVHLEAGHRALQEWLLAQRDRGMLLCLCSKNTEDDVRAVFEQNSGMKLGLRDIVASRINWNAKSTNLNELSQDLSLGLDSFIFIDDNPIECAEVRSGCPEALVLELPSEPNSWLRYLQHVWAFDRAATTKEDAERSELYRQNFEREQARKQSGTLDDFFASLDLNIVIRPMEEADRSRVAQLIERTNQFNLTTIRRSEGELIRVVESGASCLTVELSDRFGDYGLVGVLLFSYETDALLVDTFLLSCRALGRRVEHQMLAHAGEIAIERGLDRVRLPFRKTKKNQPALDFLKSLKATHRHTSTQDAEYILNATDAASAMEQAGKTVVAAVPAEESPAPEVIITDQTTLLEYIASELSTVDAIRRAIEAAIGARSSRTRSVSTPVEELVAGIWTQVLRVASPAPDANFFALGGHSLLAAQVVARIRQSLNIELPLRALFESPTIRQLANEVEAARQAQAGIALRPLTRRAAEHRHVAPLSFAQQRIWFLQQLEPGNPFYNIPQKMRLRGSLNIDALKKSVIHIMRRHEALRTTFHTINGETVQTISQNAAVTLERVDLRPLSEEIREAEAQRLSMEEALAPFDLERGPLLRVRLLQLQDDDYLLLVTMHHIVSDRWSMGVFAGELAGLYKAFHTGRGPALSALSIQYADFAVWQREWLTGEALERQAAYWKQQLDGAPAVLELATDLPRPVIQTHKGDIVSRLIPKPLVTELAALGRHEGATVFMTLLAAFQTLLSRYSRHEDIVVGSPVAGRNHADIEPLIGFFVNTLALRTDLSGDPTFHELLKRVKEVTLGAYAHQDIPFERLVEELKSERSLSYNPIFQVLFALQNAPLEALTLPELELQRLPVFPGTSVFDMSWYAIEVPEGLLVRAEYNTDLFNAGTIERLLKHFHHLLQSIVAAPGRKLSELSLLDEAEQHQLLCEFNDTRSGVLHTQCIHDFLSEKAGTIPEAIAIIAGQREITYRELNAKANQIAHWLIRRGAGPDILVGIHMERTPDMIAAIFGILKAGSAYVPLDPSYPKERLRAILDDSRARVVVSQSSLASGIPANVQTVCIDGEDWDAIAQESTETPAATVKPQNLAYVLFTSGSTGRPKGVAIEHRNAVAFIHWARDYFGTQKLKGVLFGTSIGFDMSTFEMFVTVAAGGTMILAQSALELATIPARESVTLLNTVPSAAAELVRMKALPASLKTVALAGEALPQSLAEALYNTGTVEEVHNLYGPTEVGPYATWSLVAPGSGITIGRPLTDVQAYVLDSNRRLVPIGAPGELYLAGAIVARGYFGQPALTNERFMPNPFASAKDARMYRTGDLCRWLRDGTIDYLGRIDHQVKLRGFRIELQEIETTLDRHEDVRQSLVLAREDQPGMNRLVAYVVSKDGAALDQDALRQHLKQTLPEYMVPSAFVVLAEFPLTPNGKIDRKRLPVPDYSQAESGTFVAPETAVEQTLASIWSQVLRIETIGATDHFFELGGHSLLAAQVVSRVREMMGVALPLRRLFERPVLKDLAASIQDATSEREASKTPTLQKVSRERALPLSFAQQRLWFLDQLEPGNALYNIPCTLQTRFAIDAEALARSLNAIAQKHETLRTTFIAEDGEPRQVIANTIDIPLTIVDITALPEELREPAAQELISTEAQRPFNLAAGSLLRATLIRLSEEDNRLVLNIHHIISDRWSVNVLLRELAALYRSFVNSGEGAPGQLAIQYADFAVWQREFLHDGAYGQQLEYWKKELQGAPPVLELPTDRQRLAVETFRGEVASISLGTELTAALHRLTRVHDATLFMTLLAGFQALLARYSGQDDIVIGAPIASRNHPDIEPLIGFFANTLPLRARLGDDPTFDEIIERAKQAALSGYANQDLPFEKLVEELQPERSLSHNPLVQVFFILQNAPREGGGLSIGNGLKFEHLDTETKTAKGDLFFSLAETNGGLRGRIEYNTDLFDRETIERLLAHYRNLLQAATANPHLRLSELPLLDANERQHILVDWNQTSADYPSDLCVNELFEQQAAKRPGAIACRFDDEILTYGELNRRAGQLARFLTSLGIEPGKRVGIFVERSLRMMVGLLGIQKSGAAYVPVDPGYPAERIRHIFEDAHLSALLTEEPLLDKLPRFQENAFPVPVCLDRDWQEIAAAPQARNTRKANPADPVYIIFTSGSTGRPKGVEVPHRAAVNLLLTMADVLAMGPADVFPALASFAFDMCIPELYLPLVTGGCVALGRARLAANGEELAQFLARVDATVVHATPTTWSLLLDAGFTGHGLKRAIGAEALPRELAGRLLESDSSLFNFYGPTETTVWSAVHHFTSKSEPVVVGRPLANQQIYILDSKCQPVPIGVTGEIYIGGAGVANGYFRRPELTAERFVPDPFQTSPQARMYRTGDRAKLLRDGRVQCLGRADHQVKVRGYRIELGEIEAALTKRPQVKECIAVVREDVPGDQRLVAYVTSDEIPAEAELRAWVRDRLPEYMVPAAVVALDRFPLTPNGKVDRKRLPAPEYHRPDSVGKLAHARTPTEEIISAIWADVLNLDQVGVSDNFFELGGHSLLATQVISRIRQALRIELPLRALFEKPTVAGLAARAAVWELESHAEIPPFVRVERPDRLPLSHGQQRLWFLDQLEPGNPLYNVPYLVRLRGPLSCAALEASLNQIVERHEALRTRFVMDGDEPVQKIDAAHPVHFDVIHIDGDSPVDRETNARKRVLDEIQKPFVLAEGSLLRPCVLQLGGDDHILILNTHHIVSDRWSLGVLAEELASLYEAQISGTPASLPALMLQYADYAVWQRRYLTGNILDAQLAYWKNYLSGAPSLDLPTDRPRRAFESFWGGMQTLKLAPDLVGDLRTLSRKRSATLFMTLLAAFNVLLARWSEQDDVVVGTDLANRTQLETEQLIGFFVNLLPVRTRLSGDPNFLEILARVREASLGAFANQDLPFEKIVEEVRPERLVGRNPLVDVLFVMQNTPHKARQFGGLTPGPVGVTSRTRFDLVLFVNDPDGAPFTTWMYNPLLFDDSTIARIAHQYEVLLRAVAAGGELTMSWMSALLKEAEEQSRHEQQARFEQSSANKLKAARRRTATIVQEK